MKTQFEKFQFLHLPNDLKSFILSFLSKDDLISLRNVNKFFQKMADEEFYKHKLKLTQDIDAKNLVSELERFFKELSAFYGGGDIPLRMNNNLSTKKKLIIQIFSYKDRCGEINLQKLINVTKELYVTEKQNFFKDQKLLAFCENYQNIFALYQKRVAKLANSINQSQLADHFESIYRNMSNTNTLYKNSDTLSETATEALKLNVARRILAEYQCYHFNKAISYIPVIVKSIFEKEIREYDLPFLLTVPRSCYYIKSNKCTFYLDSSGKLDKKLKDLGAVHFRQLYELRLAAKQLLEDKYAPLLAQLKVEIMADNRFTKYYPDDISDVYSPQVFLDEIDRFALSSDNYPKNDKNIDISQYGLNGKTEDQISGILSHYWSS